MNESGIRAWVMVGSYARTQTVVALVDAVGIGLIAYFLGTPVGFVLPIFVFVFLGAFIPVVGALLSGPWLFCWSWSTARALKPPG